MELGVAHKHFERRFNTRNTEEYVVVPLDLPPRSRLEFSAISRRRTEFLRSTMPFSGAQYFKIEEIGGIIDAQAAEMRITIFGWLRLLLFATGAFYLWRSALSKADKAISQSSRALRLIGAILLSAFLIYFVGLSLGLYRLFN